MDNVVKDQVNRIYTEALKSRKKFSNCYFQPDELEKWISEDRTVCYTSGRAVILLLKENGYVKVYFMSEDFEWLGDFMKIRNSSPDTFVIEVVSKGEPGDYDFSTKIPCKKVVNYERLRSGGITVDNSCKEFCYCAEEDYDDLRTMMDGTFNTIGDRIPTCEELRQFIETKSIIGIHNGKMLAGFLIFEDTKKTSYVRMICVNEACRGKGIGKKLMTSYFSEHRDFKGFTLWCRSDNKPALNLYMNKFDYKRENLYNRIYII